MRLLVCVKQVPDPDLLRELDESGRAVRLPAAGAYKMNRYDEFAVEEAVGIKERHADTRVEVLTVGPARAAEVLRRAIGMGADHGIHILTGPAGPAGPTQTAAWIAAVARPRGYDLVLAGAMSEDLMQAAVGPMLAARLDLPCATAVVAEALAREEGRVRVEREIEGGAREAVALELPAVLTIQSGINQPRYPALSHLLRANRQPLETVDAAGLPPAGAAETLIRLACPQRRRAGEVLGGSREDKALRLLTILREKALWA
jgi:electron transfer flavoprotein beta subunit